MGTKKKGAERGQARERPQIHPQPENFFSFPTSPTGLLHQAADGSISPLSETLDAQRCPSTSDQAVSDPLSEAGSELQEAHVQTHKVVAGVLSKIYLLGSTPAPSSTGGASVNSNTTLSLSHPQAAPLTDHYISGACLGGTHKKGASRFAPKN